MAVTYNVTVDVYDNNGIKSGGNFRVVTGTWAAAASSTYTGSGGDAITIPGLSRVDHVTLSIGTPKASVVDATYTPSTGKVKLITATAEVADTTDVATIGGRFLAIGK